MKKTSICLFSLLLCTGFALTLAGDGPRCGGADNILCGDEEFCRVQDGCDPEADGVCRETPTSCSEVDDPVCGCDGETYLNQCMADMAGVPVRHTGICLVYCNDFFGPQCSPGEFCQVPDGKCCCDYPGNCVPIPTECPATCRPVCGCDLMTYRTECDAIVAGITVYRPGRCNEVQGIRFVTANELEWPTVPGATSYNVYVDGMVADTESGSPSCHASGLEVGSFSIPEQPGHGELWQIEVTAVLPEGEGPMGMGSLCGNRQAGQPCSN